MLFRSGDEEDTVEFTRSGVKGELTVAADRFELVAQLGFLLGAFKQASFMAGKVLGGASVATMPIERPSTYEMVVNQRAAEALGVKIPASVQARADEVIE